MPGERVPNTFFRSAADDAGVAGARRGGMEVACVGDDREAPPVLPVGGAEFAGADEIV